MASEGLLTIIEQNTHCTACSSEEKKVAFNHYCIDCEAYYCNKCIEFHLRIPYLAKHIVLKKDEVEVWYNLQYRCKSHGRNFEFFCRNHKKLCCHICVSLQHRSCDKIDYIPECAKDESLKQEITSMIRRIDNNSQNINTLEEKFEKKSSTNEDSEQCCQKTITDYRQRINSMLNELETKTKDIIGKKFEMNSSNFTENSEELRKFKCGLEKLNQQLHTSSKGKEILMYIGLLEGETFVEDVERKLSRMDISNTKEDFELVLDDRLERCLKSISSFGYIKDKQMLLEEISTEEANKQVTLSNQVDSLYGDDLVPREEFLASFSDESAECALFGQKDSDSDPDGVTLSNQVDSYYGDDLVPTKVCWTSSSDESSESGMCDQKDSDYIEANELELNTEAENMYEEEQEHEEEMMTVEREEQTKKKNENIYILYYKKVD